MRQLPPVSSSVVLPVLSGATAPRPPRQQGLRAALLGGVSLVALSFVVLPDGPALADQAGGNSCITNTQNVSSGTNIALTDANGGIISVTDDGHGNRGNISVNNANQAILIGSCGGIATISNHGIISNVGGPAIVVAPGAVGGVIGNGFETYTSGSILTVQYGTITGLNFGIAVNGTLGLLTQSSSQNVISGATAGVIVNSAGSIGVLSNNGLIQGSARGLRNLGIINELTVGSAGSIAGINVGVRNDNIINTITNGGLLYASGTVGNGLFNTGSISLLNNQAGGIIFGNAPTGALYNTGSISTLSNSGNIGFYASNSIGVQNDARIDTLINQAGGTISGTYIGVLNNTLGQIGLLSNLGTIFVTDGFSPIPTGIANRGTIGVLSNAGVIIAGTGYSGYGNYNNTGIRNETTGLIQTLTNTGTILAATNNYAGYGGAATGILNDGRINTLTNANVIAVSANSSAAGISNYGTIGVLTNSGGIIVQSNYSATGVYNNGSIGVLTNSGLINAQSYGTLSGSFSGYGRGLFQGQGAAGIWNDGSIGVLTNTSIGRINAFSSGSSAVGIGNTGLINTLTNAGTITAMSPNEAAGIFNSGSIGALVNSGLISAMGTFGASSISGSFYSPFVYGLGVHNSGTIDSLNNSGTITGEAVYSVGSIGSIGGYYGGAAYGFGVSNAGSIGNLVNSGLISAFASQTIGSISGYNFAIGVYNGPPPFAGSSGPGSIASIGTLTNSGTIMATRGAYGGTFGSAFAAGVYNNGLIGRVSNSGLIYGQDFGITNSYNGTIGSIANLAGGSIVGGTIGLDNQSMIGSISNAGTILGGTIGLNNSGTILAISNLGGGTILGGTIGLQNSGTILAIDNLAGGTIASTRDYGIGLLNLGSTIGTFGNIGTIMNAGVIGTGYNGSAGLQNSGTISLVNNVAGGTIIGSQTGLNNTISGSLGGVVDRIVNAGLITGGFTGLANSGTIGLLSNSGTISGGSTGVRNEGSIGTLSNSGTIYGGSTGVRNYGSIGLLTNNGAIIGYSDGVVNRGSIGTLSNSGTISGGTTGVYNRGSIGLLTNSGRIQGGTDGVYNSGSIGQLTNSGMIYGGTHGLHNEGSIGALTNSGTISGGQAGIYESYGKIGLLTNSGLISGSRGIQISDESSIGLLSNLAGGVINGNGSISGKPSFGQGYGIAIETYGSIGTLSNAGTISGSVGGVINAGRLGALINMGSIVALGTLGAGLWNTGSIGSIDNSGTISGPGRAIYSTGGGLPAINNAGIISGNIEIANQNATINGSNNSLFGALINGNTTITNGDLLFGSGNIYLAHNISVNGGTGTVTNTANLLVTNTQSIAGNYTQNAAGLLTVGVQNGGTIVGGTFVSGVNVGGTLTNAVYGRLNVSGIVNMANANLLISPLSGARLAAGATYTLVDSATPTGTTYSGVKYSLAGYNSSIANVLTGGHSNLVLTVYTPVTTNTQTGNNSGTYQGPMGGPLDTINNQNNFRASDFYHAVLQYIDALPAGQQQQNAVRQTAPVQITPSGVTFQVTAAPVQALVERTQLGFVTPGTNGAGVAAGSSAHNLRIWMQAMGGLATRSGTSGADGYSSSYGGAMFGTDWTPSDRLLVGGGFATVFGRSNASGITSGSNTSVTSYQLLAYSTYRLTPSTFIYGQLGGGTNDFVQNRHIGFLGSNARAHYNGQQLTMKGGVGHDITLREVAPSLPGNMTLTPLVGLSYVRSSTAGYAETGAGLANLAVNSSTVQSVTADVGARLTSQVETSFGRVIPELRLAWLHDFEGGRVPTTGQIFGTPFSVSNQRISTNGVRVNLAATLVRSDRLTIRAEYEGDIRSNYNSHSGLVRASLGF